MKKQAVFAILILGLLLACGGTNPRITPTIYEIVPTLVLPPTQPGFVPGTPQVLLVTQAPMATRPANVYPIDAEGVVIGFLTAYQSDPDGMMQYLSSGLKQSVPQGGPGLLLRFRDMVEGYGLTNVAVNQNPPYAVITVSVKMDGLADTSRIFKLAKEADRWVITDILLPED